MKRCFFTILFAISGLSWIGCGYGFQNSKNPLYTKEGIRKIFVEPVVNDTYKAGVENIVYNSLVRSLASHGRVILVHNKNDADALLKGVVRTANFGASAVSLTPGLNPQGFADREDLPTKRFAVSTEYMANLVCSFTLIRKNDVPQKRSLIWNSDFARSKPFPAANQLDVPGTTSALINESEFDRALLDLSRSMMDDVHESMLAMF